MSDESRTFRSLVALGVLGLLVLLVLGAVEGWRDLAAARDREALLDRRLAETREGIEALRRRIERLERDPATLERLARDHLGMVRPDDVVILTRPDPTPAPTQPAPSPPPGAS